MDYEVMMNGNVKIGTLAPEFEANSTMGKVSLSDYKGKWLVFFSHPGDFTPVCTTEMIAFAKANTYFDKMNTCLLGLSIDSNSSHLAWMYDIYCKTGIVVPFPILSDRSGSIARKYGMISNEIDNTATVRTVFIINPCGVVRAILIYPMEVGRCVPEILRTVEALQTAEICNGMTPANWVNGNPIIKPMPTTFAELQERNEQIAKKRNGVSWYLSFKECPDNRSIDKSKEEVKEIADKNKK